MLSPRDLYHSKATERLPHVNIRTNHTVIRRASPAPRRPKDEEILKESPTWRAQKAHRPLEEWLRAWVTQPDVGEETHYSSSSAYRHLRPDKTRSPSGRETRGVLPAAAAARKSGRLCLAAAGAFLVVSPPGTGSGWGGLVVVCVWGGEPARPARRPALTCGAPGCRAGCRGGGYRRG